MKNIAPKTRATIVMTSGSDEAFVGIIFPGRHAVGAWLPHGGTGPVVGWTPGGFAYGTGASGRAGGDGA